ncbi:MAG TPA: nuclear transport factor 2 family protein [Steroidobacteraceae bacterium]|nr:nuclear transport factor 2 family protein [Steroidobacteraceae bacterium]
MADTPPDELFRRVARLEDLEAIRRLKARYLNACDQQDPDSAKSCFAEGEVLIDMGHVGVFRDREAFAALYRSAGCHPHILDTHHGANPEIEHLDDTHAKGLWSLDYRNINTRDKTVTLASLIYHDEYEKIDGRWKIRKSVSEFKSALHLSYASGTLEPILAARSVAGAVDYSKG